MDTKWKLPLLSGLVGVLVGIAIGWWLYHPARVVESYKPAVVLSNEAVALERKPDLPPPAPIKQAAKELGGKLVRAGTVVVKPTPVADSSPGCTCKELTLDYGVVDEGNGSRLVFHTDDGTIIGGTDSPLVPYVKAERAKWEMGVIVPIDNPKGVGPSVARHIGPITLGIAAAKTKQGGWTGFATATLSW